MIEFLPTDPTAILYLAFQTDYGLAVRFEGGFTSARNLLYSARNATCDPDLRWLEIRASPVEEGVIFIVRRRAQPEAQPGAQP